MATQVGPGNVDRRTVTRHSFLRAMASNVVFTLALSLRLFLTVNLFISHLRHVSEGRTGPTTIIHPLYVLYSSWYGPVWGPSSVSLSSSGSLAGGIGMCNKAGL